MRYIPKFADLFPDVNIFDEYVSAINDLFSFLAEFTTQDGRVWNVREFDGKECTLALVPQNTWKERGYPAWNRENDTSKLSPIARNAVRKEYRRIYESMLNLLTVIREHGKDIKQYIQEDQELKDSTDYWDYRHNYTFCKIDGFKFDLYEENLLGNYEAKYARNECWDTIIDETNAFIRLLTEATRPVEELKRELYRLKIRHIAIRKDFIGKRTDWEANFGDMLYVFSNNFEILKPIYNGLFILDKQREIVKEIRTIVRKLALSPDSGIVQERNKAGETGVPPQAILSKVFDELSKTRLVEIDEKYRKWMGR